MKIIIIYPLYKILCVKIITRLISCAILPVKDVGFVQKPITNLCQMTKICKKAKSALHFPGKCDMIPMLTSYIVGSFPCGGFTHKIL